MHIMELENIPQSQKISDEIHALVLHQSERWTLWKSGCTTNCPHGSSNSTMWLPATRPSQPVAPAMVTIARGNTRAALHPNMCLCKIRENSTKFRGYPFVQDLRENMARITRNKPNKSNQKIPPTSKLNIVGKAAGLLNNQHLSFKLPQ